MEQFGKLPQPMEILIESSPPQGETPRKGRVLRVKCGYNPNSSSYGSIVFVMPAALLAATGIFGAVAGLIGSALVQCPGGEPTDPNPSAQETNPNENPLS